MKSRITHFVVLLFTFCVISGSAISQTTNQYDLTPANVYQSVPPLLGGSTNPAPYASISEPLVSEPESTNTQFIPNTNTFYAPAGNTQNVYFGGDLPPGLTQASVRPTAIYTNQVFTTTDFPVCVKTRFFNRQSNGVYNQSAVWIGPSNYMHYASPFTQTPNTNAREGITVRAMPNIGNIYNHQGPTQGTTDLGNSVHNISGFNSWYDYEVVFDLDNNNLEVREGAVNNQLAIPTNSMFTGLSWLNSFRLALGIDDLAQGFEITTNCVSLNSLNISSSGTTICAGECIDLSATVVNESVSNPNTTFNWILNGANNPSATGANVSNVCFPQVGTYTLEVKTSNPYDTLSETIFVTVNPTPQINLNNDSILCGDQFNLTLNANSPGSSYQWSTGANSSSIQLNLTDDELVWLEIDSNGCSARDSVYYEINPVPSLNIGADTTLCGNLFQLNYNADTANADSYLWFNGTTLPSLTFQPFSTTTVWLEITEDGCSARDSLVVTIAVDSNIQPISDTAVCNTVGQLTFDAFAPGATYLWSNGSSNSTLTVLLSSDTGIWVDIDIDNCVFRDSISVFYLFPPTANILGDSLICPDESVSLTTVSDNFSSLLWSTGETTDTIEVTTEGTYSVLIENICGTDQDSFNLMGYTPVSLDFLPRDTVLCKQQELFWDFTGKELTLINADSTLSQQLYLYEPGIYTFQIKDECTVNSRVMYVELCDCDIFIPNAFTPNRDLTNDDFSPVLSCQPWKYRFDIWNRWGQMVFTTDIYGRKWNGQQEGVDSPIGIYYYTVMYQYLPGRARRTYEGKVSLIR